ncbi:MAG TPA: hypothetical protein VFZ53_25435 [Polyangiaceae bacterium]
MEEPVTISGGWYVVRLLERPAGLGTTLLPERILTLSSCLTQFFPDTWAIEWASHSADERLTAVRKLGIDAGRLPVVMSEMTAALASGELGWPSVWRSMGAARRAAIRFGFATGDFALIELGVPVDCADELLSHTRPSRGAGPGGFFEHLSSRTPVHAGGAAIGWEPLGVEVGADFHSWLCNSLHAVAKNRLGIEPGELGLLRTEADARAVDRMIAGGVGAEPVPWFPGVVLRHGWAV